MFEIIYGWPKRPANKPGVFAETAFFTTLFVYFYFNVFFYLIYLLFVGLGGSEIKVQIKKKEFKKFQKKITI